MEANFLSARVLATGTILLGILLFCGGCSNPESIVESLEKQLAAYTQNPTPEAEAEITNSFARLDAEIARLQTRGAASEAAQLAQQRNNLRARFEAARLAGGLLKARQALENIGDTVRQAGEQIGESIREATRPSSAENP
jgi:hypothetical protein